jgi:hypothetical protein
MVRTRKGDLGKWKREVMLEIIDLGTYHSGCNWNCISGKFWMRKVMVCIDISWDQDFTT